MPVVEGEEQKPGVILDFDAEGNLVAVEILDASKRVSDTSRIDYRTVG
jgi:uncharacterized protein YuzE